MKLIHFENFIHLFRTQFDEKSLISKIEVIPSNVGTLFSTYWYFVAFVGTAMKGEGQLATKYLSITARARAQMSVFY